MDQIDELWRMLSALQKKDPKAYHQVLNKMKNQSEIYEQKEKLNDCYHVATISCEMTKLGTIDKNFKIKLCRNVNAPYPKDETEPLKFCQGEEYKTGICVIIANDKMLEEILASSEDTELFLENLVPFVLANSNMKLSRLKVTEKIQEKDQKVVKLNKSENFKSPKDMNLSDLSDMIKENNTNKNPNLNIPENKRLVEGLQDFLPNRYKNDKKKCEKLKKKADSSLGLTNIVKNLKNEKNMEPEIDFKMPGQIQEKKKQDNAENYHSGKISNLNDKKSEPNDEIKFFDYSLNDYITESKNTRLKWSRDNKIISIDAKGHKSSKDFMLDISNTEISLHSPPPTNYKFVEKLKIKLSDEVISKIVVKLNKKEGLLKILL